MFPTLSLCFDWEFGLWQYRLYILLKMIQQLKSSIVKRVKVRSSLTLMSPKCMPKKTPHTQKEKIYLHISKVSGSVNTVKRGTDKCSNGKQYNSSNTIWRHLIHLSIRCTVVSQVYFKILSFTWWIIRVDPNWIVKRHKTSPHQTMTSSSGKISLSQECFAQQKKSKEKRILWTAWFSNPSTEKFGPLCDYSWAGQKPFLDFASLCGRLTLPHIKFYSASTYSWAAAMKSGNFSYVNNGSGSSRRYCFNAPVSEIAETEHGKYEQDNKHDDV